MGQVTTIGLDIAKSIFQVQGVDATGDVVVRRRRILPFPRDQAFEARLTDPWRTTDVAPTVLNREF